METKFTKGNWFVGKFPTTVVSTEKTPINSDDEEVNFYGGYLVAETCDKYTAKLIAAAPELLEACITLVTFLEENFDHDTEAMRYCDEADLAIKKATE